MITAAHAASQQNMTLGTFIFTVASGLLVLVLGYIGRSVQKMVKQHYWLVEQVNNHSKAIETQGRAIESLLKDRREARRKAQT